MAANHPECDMGPHGNSTKPEYSKAFEQDLLSHLDEQRIFRPAMRSQDVVKFIFQAMLGVGHLLSSRERVRDYILREMDSVHSDPSEPLCETLSPSWIRLNLRRAKAEQIEPDTIARLMLPSQQTMQFTRQDVFEVCKRATRFFVEDNTDRAELAHILDESWLPSHSDTYKKEYHPAYRVIPAQWLPYMDAVKRISRKKGCTDRLLITLDGPCASGKTTLAQKLSVVFRSPVIHMDDFVIPHAQKTSERLAMPGGNCDAERLEEEVVKPWKQGVSVKYRKYVCCTDGFLPEETLPDSDMLIIEGCYCNLPQIRRHADICLFLDAPWNLRKNRLEQRETPASMSMFYERWIPLEEAYFRAYKLPNDTMLCIGP